MLFLNPANIYDNNVTEFEIFLDVDRPMNTAVIVLCEMHGASDAR